MAMTLRLTDEQDRCAPPAIETEGASCRRSRVRAIRVYVERKVALIFWIEFWMRAARYAEALERLGQ